MDADAKLIAQYQPQLVRLGAHKVAHLDEPLMNHLIRTYHLLREMECDETICLSGLFHGAYGTQGLHTDEIGDIPTSQREIVKSSIGENAEQLVYHFSIMSYESLSKSFRNILKPEGQPCLKDRRNGQALNVSLSHFQALLALELADVLAHTPTQKYHTCLNLPAEYGMFWEIVAEYLGKKYMSIWNKTING